MGKWEVRCKNNMLKEHDVEYLIRLSRKIDRTYETNELIVER